MYIGVLILYIWHVFVFKNNSHLLVGKTRFKNAYMEETDSKDTLVEVRGMLAHFENTFKYTTGWDWRHEDWYSDGEMCSWRRTQHPIAGQVTFKFVEDGKLSCCCVWVKERDAILYTRKEYDDFIVSLGETSTSPRLHVGENP